MVKKIVKSKKKMPPKKLATRGKKKVVSPAKKKKVSAIPKNYHQVIPYLITANADQAISFYKAAFGAKLIKRMDQPNGKIAHAELKIGDSKIMLSDEYPEMDVHSPVKYGGSAVIIHLYIKNVDAIVEKAIVAGAKLLRPVADMFYGDRSGMLEDPHGYKWCVSTHIEDVSDAKTKKRAAQLFGSGSK